MKGNIVILPYTICFCCCDGKVLMLYRYKPPNQERWNGLGGKMERDETPEESVRREVLEEAGIDLRRAGCVRFAGIVTWPAEADSTRVSRGMYAFVADFGSEAVTWEGERVTEEGMLCWHAFEWVCDLKNTAVVSNIPRFLPEMLVQHGPREYYCDYQHGRLVDVVVQALPDDLVCTFLGREPHEDHSEQERV